MERIIGAFQLTLKMRIGHTRLISVLLFASAANYKDIIKTLEDGRSHRCLVKVRPVDKDDKLGLGSSREFVQILDAEFLPDGVRP